MDFFPLMQCLWNPDPARPPPRPKINQPQDHVFSHERCSQLWMVLGPVVLRNPKGKTESKMVHPSTLNGPFQGVTSFVKPRQRLELLMVTWGVLGTTWSVFSTCWCFPFISTYFNRQTRIQGKGCRAWPSLWCSSVPIPIHISSIYKPVKKHRFAHVSHPHMCPWCFFHIPHVSWSFMFEISMFRWKSHQLHPSCPLCRVATWPPLPASAPVASVAHNRQRCRRAPFEKCHLGPFCNLTYPVIVWWGGEKDQLWGVR